MARWGSLKIFNTSLRSRHLLLQKWETFVAQGFTTPSHVEKVAKKYKVWPSQIGYWKSKLEGMAPDPTIQVDN